MITGLKNQSPSLEQFNFLETMLGDVWIRNKEINFSSVVEYHSYLVSKDYLLSIGSSTSHLTMWYLIPRSLVNCGVGSVDLCRSETYTLRLCRVAHLIWSEKPRDRVESSDLYQCLKRKCWAQPCFTSWLIDQISLCAPRVALDEKHDTSKWVFSRAKYCKYGELVGITFLKICRFWRLNENLHMLRLVINKL
jgi:hypothetical protein